MNTNLIKQLDQFLAQNRRQLIEDLKMLVRIPSKKGDPLPGAMFGESGREAMDAAVSLYRQYGFDAEIYGDGHYALAKYGNSEKCIGFFNHIDVVAEGEGWSNPPYEPIETDDYIIGRGAADNKNGVLASLYAVRAIKELNIPVKSCFQLFLGGDEETGMTDIDAFVKQQTMPDFSFVVDSMFPVCNGEKGSMDISATCQIPFQQIISISGEATNIVSARVADNGRVSLKWDSNLYTELQSLTSQNTSYSLCKENGAIQLSAKGITKHSSEPEGSVNAIWLLAKVLCDCEYLNRSDFQIMKIAVAALENPYGEAMKVNFKDQPSGQTYCICRSATTENGLFTLNFNPRYCVTVRSEEIISNFSSYFTPLNWNVVCKSQSDGYYIPANDSKIVALSQIYADITGRTSDIAPVIIGGGTYARKLRNAVGFGPTYPDSLPEGHGSAHNPNETLIISQLLEVIKIYVLSIMAIDRLL